MLSVGEYSRVLGQAHAVRLLARHLDVGGELDEAIASIDRAEAAGPVLDPSLYRARGDAMREDREVLVAVRDLARLAARGAATGGGARA